MTEQACAEDNIRIRVFDASDVATPEDADDADPKCEYATHNVTRDVYHRAVIGELSGENADIEVDAFALGDSAVATSTLADTAALGNETFRTISIDTDTAGRTFRCSVFIDSTEANGSFEEAALIAERPQGDIGINRFLIDDIDPGGLLKPKSAGETVSIDIEITQDDT